MDMGKSGMCKKILGAFIGLIAAILAAHAQD